MAKEPLLGPDHGVGGDYGQFDNFPPNPGALKQIKDGKVEKAKFAQQGDAHVGSSSDKKRD